MSIFMIWTAVKAVFFLGLYIASTCAKLRQKWLKFPKSHK